MEYKVNFQWDDEAFVWVATSEDVRGLVLESGSYDALVERCRHAIPELLELNGADPKDVTFCILSERHERAYA